MKILGRLAVFPTIPPRIGRLHELAYNLWWTWNPDAQVLYSTIDPELWQRSEHNAVRLLSEAAPERLNALAHDTGYLAHYDLTLANFDEYMGNRGSMGDGSQLSDMSDMDPQNTWYSRTYPEFQDNVIAYFSAEFGLHESLPIYSGGLGILSGDHCKEASDLGLPLVSVGFLYPQGYFRQRINREGGQEAIYEKLHFSQVAAVPATDTSGREVIISVGLPGRKVYAKVWRVQVGRVSLYLMDTDIEPNAPADRTLSARLYGGDHEMRLAQEIMLGIGGVRALRALRIDAKVWHMNEGHAAFLQLERCRELVNGLDVPFEVAHEIAAANAIFTTHTPVAAGNDAFDFSLIDTYFGQYWSELRLDRDSFHALAYQQTEWGPRFSMTVLALRLSAQQNGVSRLHGEVSRRMWHFLWPEIEVDEVPIGSVTNGVHTATWLAPRLNALYKHYLGSDWYARLDELSTWTRTNDIPDGELWEAHRELKADLIAYARARLARQRIRLGESAAAINEASKLLDPQALTLGFARRFATYKRATLIFNDPLRLERLLNNTQHPVQIIFAGKAHPADKPGQDLIKQVYEFSRRPEFEGKIVFLEDYDMDMARHLVSGCDVWLNNPIRPHEASGTSGQKASLNGLPNCSILDGWWEEGWNGDNGWAFGESREYQSDQARDEADSSALYDVLEQTVVPLYFEAGLDGVPHNWVAVMKQAIQTVAPAFSMRRMVKDYVTDLYVPARKRGLRVDAGGYALAKKLAAWRSVIRAKWGNVTLEVSGPREGQLAVGQPVEIVATLRLGDLKPEDVRVELVVARDEDGLILDRRVLEMERVPVSTALSKETKDTAKEMKDAQYRYTGSILPENSGSLIYGVRLVPSYPDLAHLYGMGMAHWA
ncbi:MAG: alpha-glucan family phosphorylase [Ktedonobacterales bacterium]